MATEATTNTNPTATNAVPSEGNGTPTNAPPAPTITSLYVGDLEQNVSEAVSPRRKEKRPDVGRKERSRNRRNVHTRERQENTNFERCDRG